MQIPQPPRSGLIQVNLDSGDTRVVACPRVIDTPLTGIPADDATDRAGEDARTDDRGSG